ncbi:MAG: glycerol-3-phosphate acyltransferase [Phycisphaerales bacterium]|nr:MAG: glycerol-3-phosphate acyltransferase [Phycisphaerales bacterium]
MVPMRPGRAWPRPGIGRGLADRPRKARQSAHAGRGYARVVEPQTLTALLLAGGAYLLGSIPVGYLIARAKGVNILAVGSGNIGATNVRRVLGPKPGALCFVLDVLKGLVPTLVSGVVLGTLGDLEAPASSVWLWLLTPVLAVVGHVASPWLGMRGGKGVATGLGALLGVFWVLTAAVVLALGVWFAVLRIGRYVSLASVAAALSVPAWAALLPVLVLGRLPGSAVPMVVVAVALAALVVLRHAGNLRRIAQGTEPKIGRPRRAGPQTPA